MTHPIKQFGLDAAAAAASQALAQAAALAPGRPLAEQLKVVGAVLDQLPCGVLLADARLPGRPLVYASRRVQEITGYSPGELLGKSCAMLQGGDRDQPGVFELRAALRQGQGCDVLLRNYRRNGQRFLNQLRLIPLRAADGTLEHYLGLPTDVTHQREDQQRALEIIDKIDAAFLSLDGFWRLNYGNPGAERLFGRTLATLRGLTLWDLLPSAICSESRSQLEQVLQYRRTATFTAYLPEISAWVETRAFPTPEGISVYLRDVSRQKEHEARLEYHARHDLLTGLLNRRSFLADLARHLHEAGNQLGHAALALVDVDGFDRINQSLGQALGDELLRALAIRLRSADLAATLVARIGPDQFLALLPRVHSQSLQALGLVLSDRLSLPLKLRGATLQPSVSIGLSPLADLLVQGSERGPLHRSEALLMQAGVALREARRNGPGQVYAFDDSLQRDALRRQQLLLALQADELLDQLHLVYQTQVDLQDGSLVGLEALLRWAQPELGLVPPGEFVPLLESSGLIRKVGRWVLATVCRQSAQWRDAGLQVPVLSINASPIEFLDAGYPDQVVEALRECGLPAGALAVEVTESLAIGNLQKATQQIDTLRAAGVEVHLDDFGSGYAHLRSLRGLGAEVVKIDRSLVQGLGADPDASAMLRAVVRLVHDLGRLALIEGVETAAEAQHARDLGCDRAQGHHFSRPVRAEALTLSAAASRP